MEFKIMRNIPALFGRIAPIFVISELITYN